MREPSWSITRRSSRSTGSVSRSFTKTACSAKVSPAETAEPAVEQASAGLLVLTALSVNSTLGVITRLRELGVARFLIAQALVGLVGQRLVRRVCPECAAEYTPAPEVLRKVYGENAGRLISVA